jgi:hypothetical protein
LSGLFAVTLPPLSRIAPAAEMVLTPARGLVPVQSLAPVSLHPGLPMGLLALWLAGMAVLTWMRWRGWRRLRRMVRRARPAGFAGPIGVRVSASPMEPGLVGILRPVVLLPAGLARQMAPAEMDTILAHEAAHHRRRDNLTAALHMLVETLFWFWPVVWLLGARMIGERERACDEQVLAQGHDPQLYAGAIVKVCRFCVRAPLACVSGASAGLAGRVERIALADVPDALGAAKGMLLATLAVMMLAAPLLAGMAPARMVREVRLQAAAAQLHIRRNIQQMAVQIGALHATAPQVYAVPVRPRAMPVPPVALPPQAPPGDAAALRSAAPDAVIAPSAPPHPLPAKAQGPASAALDAPLALVPSGAGAPGAVTCRVPQYLPGSRLKGPKVCKTNHLWALLRTTRMQISPDGTRIIPTASRPRNLAVLLAGCAAAGCR